MRISDWSSDVCSSDLPPKRGRGAAAATPDATASCIHQPAAVEPQHAAAARGEVFVVGHQHQGGAGIGVHREQQLDHRLAGVGVEVAGDRKSTRLNSSHYCAARMPSSACKKKTQYIL